MARSQIPPAPRLHQVSTPAIHLGNPAGEPHAGSDRHLTVVDQTTGWEYDLWHVQWPPSGNQLTIGSGGRTRVDGDGTATREGGDGTAAGFGSLAGRVRAEEMLAGHIDHALFVTIDCDDGSFVYPAFKRGGRDCASSGKPGGNADAPPLGTRLQLRVPPGVIDGLNIPTWKKTLLHAMARYGMFFGDTGSQFASTIETESGNQYTSLGHADRWQQLARDNGWPLRPAVTDYPWEHYLGYLGLDADGTVLNSSGLTWTQLWKQLVVLDPCVSLPAGCTPLPHVPAVDVDRSVRSFVAGIPRRNDGQYTPPTSAQFEDLKAAAAAVVAGDVTMARARLGRWSYVVDEVVDTRSRRRYVRFAERRRPDGTWPSAWGWYLLPLARGSTTLVEAPHPVADQHSHELALRAYHRAGAPALLVAGAHRDAVARRAADVAHQAGSAFEAVHRGLLVGQDQTVLQLHGFASSSHAAEYGDVTLSSGDLRPEAARHAQAHRVAAALRASPGAFVVCVFDPTSGRCRDLGGTTNVQGQSARQRGVHFLHVEVSNGVRASEARRTDLVHRTVDALRGAVAP